MERDIKQMYGEMEIFFEWTGRNMGQICSCKTLLHCCTLKNSMPHCMLFTHQFFLKKKVLEVLANTALIKKSIWEGG